jgi:hypothetical protein
MQKLPARKLHDDTSPKVSRKAALSALMPAAPAPEPSVLQRAERLRLVGGKYLHLDRRDWIGPIFNHDEQLEKLSISRTEPRKLRRSANKYAISQFPTQRGQL